MSNSYPDYVKPNAKGCTVLGGVRNLQVLHMSKVYELALEEAQRQEDRNIAIFSQEGREKKVFPAELQS